jgi:hypothetical protein
MSTITVTLDDNDARLAATILIATVLSSHYRDLAACAALQRVAIQIQAQLALETLADMERQREAVSYG